VGMADRLVRPRPAPLHPCRAPSDAPRRTAPPGVTSFLAARTSSPGARVNLALWGYVSVPGVVGVPILLCCPWWALFVESRLEHPRVFHCSDLPDASPWGLTVTRLSGLFFRDKNDAMMARYIIVVFHARQMVKLAIAIGNDMIIIRILQRRTFCV
jgi:hypothetical protein